MASIYILYNHLPKQTYIPDSCNAIIGNWFLTENRGKNEINYNVSLGVSVEIALHSPDTWLSKTHISWLGLYERKNFTPFLPGFV